MRDEVEPRLKSKQDLLTLYDVKRISGVLVSPFTAYTPLGLVLFGYISRVLQTNKNYYQ